MMTGATGQYRIRGSVVETQHYRSGIHVCVLVEVQNIVQVCMLSCLVCMYVCASQMLFSVQIPSWHSTHVVLAIVPHFDAWH